MTSKEINEIVERIIPDKKDNGCICTWLGWEGNKVWLDGYNTCVDHSAILLSKAIQSGDLVPRERLLTVEEVYETIREVISGYAGEETLCDETDGIEYAEQIIQAQEKKVKHE